MKDRMKKYPFNPAYYQAHNDICKRRDTKRLYFDPLRIDLSHGRCAGASSFCAIEALTAIEKSVQEYLKPQKAGKPLPFHTAQKNDTACLINPIFICSEECYVRHTFELLKWAIDLLGLRDRYELRYQNGRMHIVRRKTGNTIRVLTIRYLCGLPKKGMSFFVIDEADTFLQGDFCYILSWIHATPNVRNRIVLCSWNPKKDDWITKQGDILKIRDRANYKRVHATYLTMPRKWISKSFVRYANRQRESNPKAYSEEYLGLPYKEPIKNVPHGTIRGNKKIAGKQKNKKKEKKQHG